MTVKTLDPSYIAGFVDGEGCFTIIISKHKQKRLGLDARLHFEIELRADDLEILKRIQKTLNCGRIYHIDYSKYGWSPHVEYKGSSIKHLTQKVIPFFKKHQLQTKKKHSFNCFCTAAKIFQRKEHLTLAGINKLRVIRKNMNQYRKKMIKGSPRCGKTARRAARDSLPAMASWSQNTARQASKVSSARSGRL